MTITIPQNYNEITIEQMIRWNKAVEENQTSILEYQMVSILCDISFIDVLNIPHKEFKEILIELTKLFETEPALIDRFEMNGITYGFIPNFDNLTTAEYIDLDTYAETDILRFLAVAYRPIQNKFGKLYNIEDYKGTEANYLKMAHAPAMAFLGAKVFFWDLSRELLKHLPTFLEQELTTEQQTLLAKNGVGISQLTQSLTEITSNIPKFTNLQSFNS